MIYLFYGDEEYLIENKIKFIKKDFFKNTPKEEENIIKINFKDEGLSTFLSDFEQISFDFLDRKIYLIYNSIFFTQETQFKKINTNEKEKLINILKEYQNNEDKCIVFISNDSKLINNKIIDIFPKDNVSLISKIKADKWYDLIQSQFKSRGFKIDDDSINEMIKRSNYNYQIYINEASKLMLYADDKVISLDKVNDIFSYNPDDNIFNLSNAILEKNKQKIFDSYNDLKMMGKQIVYIINSLTTFLLFVDQVLYLKKVNKDYISIANLLKANTYRVKKTLETKLDHEKVISMINELANLDKDIKLGNINQYLGFELFLSNI